jgi:hypothetical protein
MAMHNLDLFSYYDVSKYWKEGKDCGHSRLSVDDKERNVIDLEAIGEIVNSGTPMICMRDHDDFVPSVNEFPGAYQPYCSAFVIGRTYCG